MSEPTTIDQAEQSEPKKTYAPWVGVVMAWLLPGLPHFLTGHRRAGIAWFCFPVVLLCFFILSLVGSRTCFLVGLVLAIIAYLVWLVALLVSSYRPVRRIGWAGWVLLLLFAAIGLQYVYLLPAWVMKQYCAETFKIDGMSMAPTLQGASESSPGVPKKPDRIAVNKMIYRFSEPKRGDVVVYRTTTSEGKAVAWTHRIVGLPGETVDIEAPYVLINGERVVDPPVFETMSEKNDGYSGYVRLEDIGLLDADDGVFLPMTLKSDEYFILGDNSERSLDSRFAGPIKREDILGKIIRIYLPLDRFRDVK